MKTCSKCRVEKTLDCFGRDRSRSDGLAWWCKPCRRISARRGYSAHKQYQTSVHRSYGISYKEYEVLLLEQGGRCAICATQVQAGARKGLHVDHCHATGRIRGLLCGICNRGLGNFRDNPDTLLAAITYLEGSCARA